MPAHTRSDFQAHLELFPHRAPFQQWFGNRFENFVRRNRLLVDDAAPTPIAFGDKPLIRLWDLDRYSGSNPSADTDQGLAEYSNANFASLYTVFTEGFAPTDQYAFPYPRQSSTNLADLIQQQFTVVHVREAEDQVADLGLYLSKTGDGQLIEHFLRAGYLTRDILDSTTPGLLRLTFTFDDLVHRDYAAALVPRAIGYSQALLDYFFRGKLDAELIEDPTDEGRMRLEGSLVSSEAPQDFRLADVVAMHEENPEGLRTAMAPPVALEGTTAQLPEISLPRSDTATRFVAVYQGTLGKEERDPASNSIGAVVGKVFENPRVEEVFLAGGRWQLRTPTGVFPLPIMQEIEDLRWGNVDNTLVGRTALGPGAANVFRTYRINRPPGSAQVPMRIEGADLVVDVESVHLDPQSPEPGRVLPDGLALGTTVVFTGVHQVAYDLLTFTGRQEILYDPLFPSDDP